MNINVGSLITFTLFATLSSVPSSAYAQETSAPIVVPPWVQLKELKWAGTGCPPDSASVAVNVAPNRDALRVVFSSLTASAGPKVPITKMRNNCSLIARLSFPKGWSFTIADATYRGFAKLDNLVEGTQRTGYFFEGDFPSSVLQVTLKGPFYRNYQKRDTPDFHEVAWSPCAQDRALVVNTEVRVNNRQNRAGSGLINLKTERLGIKWRRCR